MPTKRPDETQDAFVIRCIRDDEAEACIEAIIEHLANGRHSGSAAINAIRARIGSRAQG